MKKIEIVTILDNPNFGTYLQAFALGLVLKKKGYAVEVLYYLRPKWHKSSLKGKILNRFDVIYKLYAKFRHNKGMLQRVGCRNFVRKELKLTKPYYSYLQVLNNPPSADIYLTGSDQVWNTSHNGGIDKVFYLGFVPDDMPKFAYGASIGMSTIPDEYKVETYRLLKRYQAISVRENTNIDLLKSIGINSEWVLDPTFLLKPMEWEKYTTKHMVSEKYILVYSVESNKQNEIIKNTADYLSRVFNMKVIEVSYADKAIDGCDEYYLYSTPDDFLDLVANSSFIVGSSFHFTAFAINFNKQFITVAPENFSSRIDSLLKLTELQNRKISNYDENIIKKVIESSINYHRINDILSYYREISFKYINKIVG